MNYIFSGMILNRVFQPHESHLPYIQKFLIDYNLFGMSYLHVPLEFVSKRFVDDEPKFRKKSVSHMEVDFQAIHILNRLEINEDDTKKAANPGIESLWEDERQRRNEMINPPPLESSIFKVDKVPATESDKFYQQVLAEKIQKSHDKFSNPVKVEHEESSKDSSKSKKSRKLKTFDIKRVLDASAYAAELSQNSSMKSSQSDINSTVQSSIDVDDLECDFLNMSEVGDDVRLEENFLDMSEFIEPDEESDQLENDSILAPLSQFHRDIEESKERVESESESDDELFNDLNTTVADMEIFSQFVKEKTEDEIEIPQLDGVVDDDENLSPGEITRLNDIANNFFPQPGPSGLSRQNNGIRAELASDPLEDDIDVLNSSAFNEGLNVMANNFTDISSKAHTDEDIFDIKDDEEDDDHFKSFYYNKTMVAEDFEFEEVSEEMSAFVDNPNLNLTVISPALDPPDPTKVLEQLKTYNLLDHINKPPIYSNPKDVSGKMDVGHHVLELRGNRLIDLDQFHSDNFNCNQIDRWRSEKFQIAFGFPPKSSMMARNFMNTSKKTKIVPYNEPPSFTDAKNWLIEGSNPVRRVEEESPVKEKRNKILMVLDQKVDENQEDLDTTLVPDSSETPQLNESILIPDSQENSPANLSEFIEDDLLGKMRRKRRRTRFSRRFHEIIRSKLEFESGENSMNSSPSRDSDETSSFTDRTKVSDQSMIVKNANLPEESVFVNSADLTGPTLMDSFGFKMKLESLKSNDEHSDLTILSMELHVQTRGELKPNPEFDEISAIFYTVDGYYVDSHPQSLKGIIVSKQHSENFHYSKADVNVELVTSEMEIYEKFFQKIRDFDPDIFAGYEIEFASWGYFIQRGYVLNMNLCNALSRMPSDKEDKQNAPKNFEEEDLDRGDYFSEQKIPGRIMLDVWRLMKHEIALTSYTFENICYHVLHRR